MYGFFIYKIDIIKKQRKTTRKGSEEKEKKQQYCRERYKKLLEHEKQRLVEYRVNCYKMWENASQ